LRAGGSYLGCSICGGGLERCGASIGREAGPGLGVTSSLRSRRVGRVPASGTADVGGASVVVGTSAGTRSSLEGMRTGRLLGVVLGTVGSTCGGISAAGVAPPGCAGASSETGLRSPFAPLVAGVSRNLLVGRDTAPVGAGLVSLAPAAGFSVCGTRSRPFQPRVPRRSRSSGTPG
jgi:hypothetical protein